MDDAFARGTDPEPSHAAARRAANAALEAKVYHYLKQCNDWRTNFQISDDTGIELSGVTPRMAPLYRKRQVERKKDYGYNAKGNWVSLLYHRVTQQESEVAFDLGERIKQVRMMEDYIEKKQEALDAELANHQKFVDMGRAEILAFLNQNNQKSANTEFGGCHWKPKITYRVEDKDAFRRHVIGAEAWELITWAAGAVNCEAFTEEHKMPPPGLVRNAVNILYITPPTKPKGKNKIVTP
jgi:hypothetical protein